MHLLTDITPDELSRLKDDLASGAKHPRQVKEDLAKAMVARYHSQAAAEHEAQEFIRVLREQELPEEIEEVILVKREEDLDRLRSLTRWQKSELLIILATTSYGHSKYIGHHL